jgi:group I intron endonuclease
MIIYIYTLKHPITNEVRYVGKTNNPTRRYYDHLYRKVKTYKGNWVRSVLNEGLKPLFEVIEECNETNWEERERYWITQFDNLTNSTSGGEKTQIINDETRKRLSELNTGKNNPNYGKKASKETRLKLSNLHKDKPHTQNHKDKIRQSAMDSAKKSSCTIDGIEYISISEASRILNINHSTIWNRLNNKNKLNYIRNVE